MRHWRELCTIGSTCVAGASLTWAQAMHGAALVGASSHSVQPTIGKADDARRTSEAQVVFVNVTEYWATLAQVIGDLLLMHKIAPHFERRSHLKENDLFQNEPAGGAQLGVWVVLPQPSLARLIFVAPDPQRFLYREIPLPRGLDEAGRESIAQVIESSLLSLLQGNSGMTRSEARSVLATYWTPSATPGFVDRTDLRTAATPPRRQAVSSWRPRIGVGYGLSLTGSDFGMQHGPSLTSGLEFEQPSHSVFVTASFQWCLERHRTTTEFDLRAQRNMAWLLAGWRKTMQGTNVVLVLGPGVEATRVTPNVNDSTKVSAVERRWVKVTPWVRTAAGLEWDNAFLTLQLLATVDLTPYRTRYVIERGTTTEEFASSWSIQPGFSIAALWR